jgi:hypothetical protein
MNRNKPPQAAMREKEKKKKRTKKDFFQTPPCFTSNPLFTFFNETQLTRNPPLVYYF